MASAPLKERPAERRCGELLARTEKAKGAAQPNWKTRSDDATTLKDMGLSKDESSRYQQLAAIQEKCRSLPTT